MNTLISHKQFIKMRDSGKFSKKFEGRHSYFLYLEQEDNKFVDSMKKLIGDDIFDKTLITETTEPIYDYIVEKIYQSPDYVEDVSLNKRKLKIAFNKFYENITGNTR